MLRCILGAPWKPIYGFARGLFLPLYIFFPFFFFLFFRKKKWGPAGPSEARASLNSRGPPRGPARAILSYYSILSKTSMEHVATVSRWPYLWDNRPFLKPFENHGNIAQNGLREGVRYVDRLPHRRPKNKIPIWTGGENVVTLLQKEIIGKKYMNCKNYSFDYSCFVSASILVHSV